MRAMIVGGDNIDATRRALIAGGYSDVVHWSGRKRSDLTRTVPAGIGHMVIMLEFVNHNLARRMKQVARTQRISVAYIGRKVQDGDVATRLRPTLN
jgi:hypothetical protein